MLFFFVGTNIANKEQLKCLEYGNERGERILNEDYHPVGVLGSTTKQMPLGPALHGITGYDMKAKNVQRTPFCLVLQD